MATVEQVSSPIQGLAAELRRQLETKRDAVADTRRVSFSLADPNEELGGWDETDVPVAGVTTARLNVDLPDGAEQFGVTRHAHSQVAEFLGFPFKLYERLLGNHPDLLAHVANGLLAREPKRRLVRILDGDVRAFLSDGYRPRDNWDLLEHLLPVISRYPGAMTSHCSLTETRMYVKIRLPQFERPIEKLTRKVGDVLHGGVIISNSEVGAGSLYIYPYTTILSCLNGAVHERFGQRRVHVGKRIGGDDEREAWELYSDETLKLDDEAFFAKCSDTLRAVLDETVFDAIVEDMEALATMRIGSPVEPVKVLVKREQLRESEGESILMHLIEGGDLSAFGYVQAVTAAARDLEDADRQTELEKIGGRMVAEPTWVPALAAAAA